MLHAKTYQTPNAIDPGEAPPSRPWRVVPNPSHSDVRINAERLLEEVERAGSPRSQRSMRAFVFDTDDNAPVHDQLPSVEDARLYAGRILDSSPKQETMRLTELGQRTENVGFEPKSSWNKRRCCFIIAFLLLIVIIIRIAVGVSKNKRNTPISSATPAPRQDRASLIINFLTKTGVSDFEDFENENDPQTLAANFMVNDLAFSFKVPETMDDYGTKFLERYILVVFYYALDGPDWTKQLGFLNHSTHHCSWYQPVTLPDNSTFGVGATCNKNLMVETLLMPVNFLRGIFPNEIWYMSSLKFLDLKRNQISGTIPTSFSKLTNLNFIDLRDNQIVGTIPDWIGTSLTDLEVFAFSNNSLTGTIPETIGDLMSLKTLALASNDFGGNIYMINSLTNLEYLYLSDNELTGRVDDSFLKNCRALIELDVSDNTLNGFFPVALLSHPTLNILDMHDNNLEGSFPNIKSSNFVLSFLSLYDNIFIGTIPSTIDLLKNLSHLDLTGNELTGTIPSTFAVMNLTYLLLSDNYFDAGTIPNFFGGMNSLRELGLANTNRTGIIPSWLNALTNLVFLDLSDNSMSGSIPETVGELTNLEYLLLNRNEFNGTIPSQFQALTVLKMLLLNRNNIVGDLQGICSNENRINPVLTADCGSTAGEVVCPDNCCTFCCDDTNPNCYDDLLYNNHDSGWEYNYDKNSYSFSPNILLPQIPEARRK